MTNWQSWRSLESDIFSFPDSTQYNGVEVTAVTSYYPHANVKLISWHIPRHELFLKTCVAALNSSNNTLERMSSEVKYKAYPASRVPMNSENFVNSKRVFIFGESSLSELEEKELADYAKSIDLFLQYRGPEHTLQPGAIFISHDSRDKDAVARKLANELRIKNIPVWYDEYSLKVGDSLRESIDKGIRNCRYCIVILSKNFISNPGWTKVEFNSIFTKELVEKETVILPIWHEVSVQDIYEYSPSLVDKFAIEWKPGLETTVINKLMERIMENLV